MTLHVILFKIKKNNYVSYFLISYSRKYALQSNPPLSLGFCHCCSRPTDPSWANCEFSSSSSNNDVGFSSSSGCLLTRCNNKATLYEGTNFQGDYFIVGKVGECVELPASMYAIYPLPSLHLQQRANESAASAM